MDCSICVAKNKGAYQLYNHTADLRLYNNHTADLRLCFCICKKQAYDAAHIN